MMYFACLCMWLGGEIFPVLEGEEIEVLKVTPVGCSVEHLNRRLLSISRIRGDLIVVSCFATHIV
jgi:hypothetical protein